jgi:hypothetical protein
MALRRNGYYISRSRELITAVCKRIHRGDQGQKLQTWAPRRQKFWASRGEHRAASPPSEFGVSCKQFFHTLASVPPSSRSQELGIGRLVREPEAYILSCLLHWAANWQDGEPGEAHAEVKTSMTNFPYSKLTPEIG